MRKRKALLVLWLAALPLAAIGRAADKEVAPGAARPPAVTEGAGASQQRGGADVLSWIVGKWEGTRFEPKTGDRAPFKTEIVNILGGAGEEEQLGIPSSGGTYRGLYVQVLRSQAAKVSDDVCQQHPARVRSPRGDRRRRPRRMAIDVESGKTPIKASVRASRRSRVAADTICFRGRGPNLDGSLCG